MNIYVGADYRGLELKNEIIKYLESNYNVIEPYKSDSEVNDFTDCSFVVGEHVREDLGSIGILICGSGHGVCIAANKVQGIRCIRATSVKDAILGRDHDGANILALGSEITPNMEIVQEIIDAFIDTPVPTLERRVKRFKKIEEYEREVHGN